MPPVAGVLPPLNGIWNFVGSPYPRIRAASAPSVVEQASAVSLRTGLFVELIYAHVVSARKFGLGVNGPSETRLCVND